MAEYDIGFAEKLADTARLVASDSLETREAVQTVLYLSLLSCEIGLKALLERSGMSVRAIRRRSHDLSELLKDIGKCEIIIEVSPGQFRYDSGKRLRAINVDDSYSNATIGNILEAEYAKASKYPNNIRYGNTLYHYPPLLVLSTASLIISWGRGVWDNITISSSPVVLEMRKSLLRQGCSMAFANKATAYSSLFDGDYDVFISRIEEILGASRTASISDLEPARAMAPNGGLDSGNMRVEFDYNGDYLTSFGRRP